MQTKSAEGGGERTSRPAGLAIFRPGLRSAPSLSGALGWIAAVAVGALAVSVARDFVHDDAFITLRYVQRWLDGRGLGWTAGPAVEGYTHPLWLLQIALLGLGGLDLVRACRLLGVLYLLAIAALWARQRLDPIPLLLVLSIPGVAIWSVGGLETTSFAFWCLVGCVGILAVQRSEARPALAFGVGWVFFLAALTRPEGAGLGLLSIAWIASTGSGRNVLAAATGLGLPLLLFLCLRYHVYGELLSMSSLVKLGGFSVWFNLSSGLAYLWQNAASAVFVVFCVARALRGEGRREAWVPLSMAGALVAAVLYAGGDHMGHGRFLVPPFVLLGFAAALPDGCAAASRASWRKERPDRSGRARGWQVVLLVNLLAWTLTLPVRPDPAASLGTVIGRFLSDQLPPGSLVALATAGSTPYHAPDLDFVDTLGLNDPAVARRRPEVLRTLWQLVPGHQKGDGDYVLSRRPDVIVLGPSTGYLGHSPNRWFLSDLELLESEAFHEHYAPWAFPVPLHEHLLVEEDEEEGWMRATGTALSERPEALERALAEAPGRRLTLIAFLRRDSERVPALRERGVSLLGLFEATTPRPTSVCDRRLALQVLVPCEDGLP